MGFCDHLLYSAFYTQPPLLIPPPAFLMLVNSTSIGVVFSTSTLLWPSPHFHKFSNLFLLKAADFSFSSPLVSRCIWSSLNLASCDDWESWGWCRWPIRQLHVWSKPSQPDVHVILLEYFKNDFQQNTWCYGLGCLSSIQVASSMCWWAPVNLARFLSC